MIPHDAGHPDPSSPLPTPASREVHPVAGRIGEPPAPHRPQATLPPPPALSSSPDLWSLLTALRHRWISAVLLGGTLAVIAAVTMFLLLAPRHVAFTKIRVGYMEPTFGPNSGQNDFRTILSTTANQLISRPVIWSALKRDDVKKLGLESSDPDPVQTIEDDLKVEFKENSELVTLLFTHSDPKVATTVANGIKEAYLHDWVQRETDRRAATVRKIEKALTGTTSGIGSKRNSLQTLAKNQGTVDPSQARMQRMEALTALQGIRQQQATVQIKLYETKAAQKLFDARVKALQSRAGGKDATSTVPEEVIEETVDAAMERTTKGRELLKEEAEQEKEVARYKRGKFRWDWPFYESARSRLAQTQKKIKTLRAEYTKRARDLASRGVPLSPTSPGGNQPTSPEEIKAMRAQYAEQVEQFTSLNEKLEKEITRLQAQATLAPFQASEIEQLAAEIKSDENIADKMRNDLEKARLELEAASRVTGYQDAELMKKDIKKQLLGTLVAPIAIFGAVCVGLALLEHRQRKIRSAGEISRGLGIRVVGAVPRMPHLERRLVGPGGESDLEGTPIMESIDAIRTRLLHEADVRSTRVVMVTSATAGEGKTTLASALASSLARAGRKTLLLDGDLRRPTVHELFEVPMQPGFSEVLLGEIEVAEAAVEAPQENLYLLPAGQWDREVLLALSRDGLEGVFEKLAEEFDFIVVDSHPVLSATDALLIGRQSDAVVLSVLREVSQMPRVYSAHQQLTGLGIRVLGAVINGTDPEEVFTSATQMASVA